MREAGKAPRACAAPVPLPSGPPQALSGPSPRRDSPSPPRGTPQQPPPALPLPLPLPSPAGGAERAGPGRAHGAAGAERSGAARAAAPSSFPFPRGHRPARGQGGPCHGARPLLRETRQRPGPGRLPPSPRLRVTAGPGPGPGTRTHARPLPPLPSRRAAGTFWGGGGTRDT